jgi:hypothetical protein
LLPSSPSSSLVDGDEGSMAPVAPSAKDKEGARRPALEDSRPSCSAPPPSFLTVDAKPAAPGPPAKQDTFHYYKATNMWIEMTPWHEGD